MTGLRKDFGAHSILNVDLELRGGEFCLILGENGVGKSTFFRCLLGIENYVGRVEFDGSARRENRFAGVLDESVFYPSWTARRNANYLLNESKATAGAVFDELLGPELLDRRVSALSTGQRKMLSLAIALTSTAPVLLLDEFSNGLDQRARSRFQRVLHNEVEKKHRLVLATGHEISVFGSLPTTVMVLRDGGFTDVTAAYQAREDVESFYEEYVVRNAA